LKLSEPSEAGRAIRLALLAASVTVNASPIACPDRLREPIQGELMIAAVPVRLKLESCVSVINTVGAMGSGFGVELNVPL
jgi:hypothetical protein